jgi:hypothetical protein
LYIQRLSIERVLKTWKKFQKPLKSARNHGIYLSQTYFRRLFSKFEDAIDSYYNPLFFPCLVLAQTAPPQIKALNSYVDYANQSAEEVTRVTASLIEYYPNLDRKNWIPRYVCPVQL